MLLHLSFSGSFDLLLSHRHLYGNDLFLAGLQYTETFITAVEWIDAQFKWYCACHFVHVDCEISCWQIYLFVCACVRVSARVQVCVWAHVWVRPCVIKYIIVYGKFSKLHFLCLVNIHGTVSRPSYIYIYIYIYRPSPLATAYRAAERANMRRNFCHNERIRHGVSRRRTTLLLCPRRYRMCAFVHPSAGDIGGGRGRPSVCVKHDNNKIIWCLPINQFIKASPPAGRRHAALMNVRKC